MSRATIALPEIKTLADLRKRLGRIPLERIWFFSIAADVREGSDRRSSDC
jgi:hypothetical protein